MKITAPRRLKRPGLTCRRRRRCTLAATMLALTAYTAAAAEVSLPNVFSAGQKASASQVNENFNALAVGVDYNARKIAEMQSPSRRPPSIYVGGLRVGSVINADFDAYVSGVSSTGYIFRVGAGARVPQGNASASLLTAEGTLQRGAYFYTGGACTGTGYLLPYGVAPFEARQGYVFAAAYPQDPNKAYVVKSDSPTRSLFRSIQTWNTKNESSCYTPRYDDYEYPGGVIQSFLIVAIPNNETVTGIKSDLAGNVEIRP